MRDQIRYVKRKDIDVQKWDECIRNSSNSIIYAYSFYLDCMAEQWDALIQNDYEVVMPLPWKKKYGICYLYQPFFTQQLGVFSRKNINSLVVAEFLQKAKSVFRYGEMQLNFGNAGFTERKLNNFILNLERSHKEITSCYTGVLKKNLRRSNNIALSYQKSDDYKTVIHFFREIYANRVSALKNKHYENLALLCKISLEKNILLVRDVRDKNNEILSNCLCLKDENRIYLILSNTTQKGRKNQANHFLLDQLILEFQQTKLTLDFEGSDLPGVALFYQNFGCINQPYYFYRFNSLPWPLSMFKKRSSQ